MTKKIIQTYFALVLICMLAVTSWASLHENVFVGGAKILSEPWGIATLADAYFGFLTFYILIFLKEKAWPSRLIWLVAVLALGNIAMAIYGLMLIRKTTDSRLKEIFT